ncbi:MAG: bifunctional diguanylate cyclase/phosphodiesterase [Actinomycetota bacterium]|nr:bifunctional diguanylate cyclase/phosphodiesterase [Actinomycetota bacterium]
MLTLVLVGLIGYLVAFQELEERQLNAYRSIQRADVQSLQEAAARGVADGNLRSELRDALRMVAIRPNVVDAEVIGPDGIVVAARNRRAIGQSRTSDPHVEAVLDRGDDFALRGDDIGGDPDNFHFASPVQVRSERFALETTYDHESFDARTAALRTGLLVTSILTLLIGAVVFYAVGGRALIRSHRFALRRATLDGLTGLFNQRAFADDLERIVRTSEAAGGSLSLVVLDLDNFDGVNKRLGRTEGDKLLIRVAETIQLQRPADRAYRIGPDEFALLLAHEDAATVRSLVGRLTSALRAQGIEASIGASGLRAGTPQDVLRSEAFAALAESERRGGNLYTHFDDVRADIDITSSHQLDAVREMISDEGVSTSFQPIWDLNKKSLLGLEALTRPDPRYGLPGPADAFDIAEQLGQVHALDRICVRSALRSAGDLPEGVLLFLNIAPQTLDDGAAEERWIYSDVIEAGVEVDRVVIEVTERYWGRTQPVMRHLKTLKAQGFKIALDDVGTGNSGLEMLGQVEADFVKIDRSIITAAPHDRSARAVLMAIATYAYQTGSFVIAEGIETSDILNFVEGIDAEAMRAALVVQGGQGYGLGRPSPDFPTDSPWTALD